MATPSDTFQGRGKIPSAIRNLQNKVARLEPQPSQGLITSVHPSGTFRSPVSPMAGRRSRGNSGLPRYR